MTSLITLHTFVETRHAHIFSVSQIQSTRQEAISKAVILRIVHVTTLILEITEGAAAGRGGKGRGGEGRGGEGRRGEERGDRRVGG